ncbi:MAG: hypothetical protein NTW96_02055 [Planctomycetia bacterium]|nr:hypothetical protein [Planctomycetia bacterium]
MNSYDCMIRVLRSGERLPAAEIERVCLAAGVSPGQLALDLVAGAGLRRSGDPCPGCPDGRLRVTSSKRHGARVVRYLGCTTIGCTFSAKVIIADDQVPRRRARQG